MRLESQNGRSLRTVSNSGGVIKFAPVRGPQGLPGPGAAAWTALEAVTTDAVRQAPDGSWIKSVGNRTTGATFDAAEAAFWTAVLGSAGTVEADALAVAIGAEIEDSIDVGVIHDAIVAALPVATVSQVEAQVLAGVIPRRRMDTPPAQTNTKASGVTGTPTVSAGGTGYVVGDEITLTGGTFVLPAILRVATLSGSAVATVTVIRTGIYTANPSNPVAQGSTTGVGTGATFTVSWSTNNAGSVRSGTLYGPTDAKFRFTGNGPLNLSGSGYYGNNSGNGTHSTWEWATDSPTLDIRLVGLNTKNKLYVDGQQVDRADITTDTSGLGYVWALDHGGSSRLRNYRLVCVNSGFGGVRVPSTASFSLPTRTKPLAWWLSDSYGFSTGAENISTQAAMVAGDQLGIDVLPDGVGSAGWVTSTAGDPQTRVANKFATLTQLGNVTDVVLDMGFNDAGGNMTTVATNFDATVAAIQSAAPTARIHVFGPATPVGETANLETVKNTLSARAAVAGVLFYDVSDVITASNEAIYTGVDNVHPNALGHKFIGARKAAMLKPNLLGDPT